MKITVKILAIIVLLGLCSGLLCGCYITSYSFYDNADSYSVGGASIDKPVEKLDIEWVSGDVVVACHSSDSVEFSENSKNKLEDDLKLHYWLDGTTLRIRFSASGKRRVSPTLHKTLYLTLPEGLVLEEAELSLVSAELLADGLKAKKAEIETVSGDIKLSGTVISEKLKLGSVSGKMQVYCKSGFEKLDAGTISGDLTVHTADSLRDVDVSTVSGEIEFAFEAAPEKLEISSVSGKTTLKLPEEASFTLDFSTVSGDFQSERSCEIKSGKYIFQDGKGKFNVESVSGDLDIKVLS